MSRAAAILLLLAAPLHAADPTDAVREVALGWTAFVDVKMAGSPSFRVRTLQVYVENGDRWQLAAHQSARLGR